MDGGISWDPTKAAQNQRKHGVTFEEASSIFGDPLALTMYDTRHSVEEDRELTIGWSDKGRMLTVSHTRRGLAIRIISARIATNHERRNVERR